LAANKVNGSGNGERSGAQTLALLATPLTSLVLHALADGPQCQSDLRRITGFPAHTTLRAQLRRLEALGAVSKERRDRFPGVLDYELTAAGQQLLGVVEALERWLARAPGGSLSLADSAGRAAVKAFAESWSTTMLRALAGGPLTLTELDGLIVALSYPSLERRLSALRASAHVEPRPGNGRGTPYALTGWARAGVGPLAAAIRWERRHAPGAPGVGRIDVEAALLLTVPLIALPSDASGSCRMAVELPGEDGPRLAGVVVGIERGRPVSCTSRLEGRPTAWALGSLTAWLDAIVEGDADRIEPGGDSIFARELLDAMHRVVSGARSLRG
jgi:DNA-binding HxlR family transcriptional regulator